MVPQWGHNTVYMRVVRRMADCPRFDASAGTDRNARVAINAPSFDCILLQRRLLYAGRLARSSCDGLLALLAIRFEECGDIFRALGASTGVHAQRERSGPILAWVRQLILDMATLAKLVPRPGHCLPDPAKCPGAWWGFMRDSPNEWEILPDMVAELHFLDSICDKHISAVATDIVRAFRCDVCGDSCTFASERALRTHKRMKHGIRTDMRFYADADGTCQCCETLFSTRLRLIAHLSDARRTKCRDWLLTQGRQLDCVIVATLDARDKDARQVARTGGLTLPRSHGPAINVQGHTVGRAHR